MPSHCRTYCPSGNESSADIEPGAKCVQADLSLFASCPVVAVTFRLSRWRRVMKLFNVMITEVEFSQYIGDSSHKSLRQPGEEAQASADSPLARACVWTYATLACDAYCAALNPAVLQKIKSSVSSALQSGSAADIRNDAAPASAPQAEPLLGERIGSFYTLNSLAEASSSASKGVVTSETAATERDSRRTMNTLWCRGCWPLLPDCWSCPQ